MNLRSAGSADTTGPLGPVSVCAAGLLLIVAPLLRGGNREIALIAIEGVSLGFLLCLLWRTLLLNADLKRVRSRMSARTLAVGVLIFSPVWLAVVYLLPLPRALWSALAGRDIYPQLLGDAGIAINQWLPLSLVPGATRASLLAGLPLVAAFLAGYLSGWKQLRILLLLVVLNAFAQVLLGLMQVAGGEGSALYFEANVFGRPVGTFANPNHFANYVAMGLAAYIWLGWRNMLGPEAQWHHNFDEKAAMRHRLALWIAGGVLLVVGILISRSRGAGVTGLPAGVLCVGLALFASQRAISVRTAAVLIGCVVACAVVLIGTGSLLSRLGTGDLASSASFRSLLTASTLAGAREFWPWGAGWGSFAAVYPRFQPVQIAGYADYAHDDYAQMIFEGGVFSVLLGGCFLWVAGSRALELAISGIRMRGLSPREMTSALCGLGLSGLLAHSLIEFNMHIPANAIVGALLAGIYLHPMPKAEADDRSP